MPGKAFALATDDQAIYFATYDTGVVGRVKRGGGKVEQLAIGQEGATDIVVANSRVYWVTAGRVRTVAASGGTSRELPAQSVSPWLVASTDDLFYFASESLFRVPLGGSTPLRLGSPKHPALLALGGRFIYFTSEAESGTTEIARVKPDGSSLTIVAKSQPPVQGLAADGEGVYWSAGEREVIGSDEPPPSTGAPAPMPTVAAPLTHGSLVFAPSNGGPTTVLARDRSEVGAAAVDGGFLYWTEGNALLRVEKGGGTVALVCSGNGFVSKPAFDAKHVYMQLGSELVAAIK